MNVDNPNDTRVGRAFNNPDYTGNHHFPGWGLIITPDEIRDVELFGNPLVSTAENATIEDEAIQYYIDNAIDLVEVDFDIDIIPRVRLHPEPRRGREDVPERSDIPQEAVDLYNAMNDLQKSKYYTDEGTEYDYMYHLAQDYLRTKLDHRPLIKIWTWDMYDPFDNKMLNLKKGMRQRNDLDAEVQFFPSTDSYATSNVSLLFTNVATFPYDNFPNALKFDYMSGYKNSSAVPYDLVTFIMKIASINVMSVYGDGKTSALAGGSASFNSISESFQTTLSATSAAFGARIKQYQDEQKIQYNRLKQKYSRTIIGVL